VSDSEKCKCLQCCKNNYSCKKSFTGEASEEGGTYLKKQSLINILKTRHEREKKKTKIKNAILENE
jgi:hypothetical protein